MKKTATDALFVSEKDYESLWIAVTEYFMVMEEKIPSLNIVLAEYRSAFIIAHYLRNKALLAGLLQLSREEAKSPKRLRNAALECISGSNELVLLPIKRYISEKVWSDKLWEEVIELIKAIYTILNIHSILQVKTTPDDMAYYTTLDTFFYMLPAKVGKGEKCGRLSVMNIAYMNDPNEGRILKRILWGEDDSYDKEKRQSVKYPYVFMKCFTSRIDDLPMWEMYGDHASGCCLVLDWEKVSEQVAGNKKVPLYRVCYINKTKKSYQVIQKHNPHIKEYVQDIKESLDGLQNIADVLKDNPDSMKCFMSILEQILYLFKDSSYSYEEEMRIYYNYPEVSDEFRHTGGAYPKLFVQPEFDIHLKEIIIGPKFEGLADKMPYIQEQVEMLCKETKAKVPKITMSGIEYR